MANTSETASFEADQFLKLLTDALRAGPGSPQWHEAVRELRSSGVAGADEYRMLIEAREHLESGRDYRSVRAGPGFTRKVLEGLEREAAGAGPAPSAKLMAMLGVVGIIAVIVVVMVLMYRGGGRQDGTVVELAGKVFAQQVLTGDFDEGISAEWKRFGLEPVAGRGKGLRGAVKKDEKDYRGGGICAPLGIPPGEAFAVEATIRAGGPTDQAAVQVFITDTPQFDQNPQTSTGHELVVYLLDGQLHVARADGQLAGQVKARDVNHVLVKVDKQLAVVEANGQQVFGGPHGLSPQKARYPGIRFLTRGVEKAAEDVTVQGVRVLKP